LLPVVQYVGTSCNFTKQSTGNLILPKNVNIIFLLMSKRFLSMCYNAVIPQNKITFYMSFPQMYAVKSISQTFALHSACLPEFTLMTGSFSNKIPINDILNYGHALDTTRI
jgi:hypothetical protein